MFTATQFWSIWIFYLLKTGSRDVYKIEHLNFINIKIYENIIMFGDLRPIGDLLKQTHGRPTCLIGDLSIRHALYSEVNLKSYCTHFLYCPAQLSWLDFTALYRPLRCVSLSLPPFIRTKMAWHGGLRCGICRFSMGLWLVSDRSLISFRHISAISFRQIYDWFPTDLRFFSDISLQLVSDRSLISFRQISDWFPTDLRLFFDKSLQLVSARCPVFDDYNILNTPYTS